MNKPILVVSLLVILALASPCPSRPDDQSPKPRWTADFRAEAGIDSLERRYYRPTFSFSSPLFGAPSWQWNSRLMYDQRLNGRLRGASDFWLTTGLEFKLPGNWSLEAALRHMCRHQTSRDNPVIFDINEVLGILRLHEKGMTLGLGFGGYIGKTRDFRHLALFILTLPDVPFGGIDVETEVKWVDFSQWLYEAGFSVALGPNTALFIRGARAYQFPAALYMGFRYTSGEAGGRPLENFKFAAGTVPFDERYKLAVLGEYRMEIHREGRSRLFTDVGIDSPVLYGDGFLSQFRPDKLVYHIRGEYEREAGRSLYVSWYAAYALEMPADKDLPFAGSLGTGLKLKNQPNFERLDRRFRFEIAAGWNFKYDEEAAFRAGVNTRPEGDLSIGADLECRMFGRRRARIDMRLFTNIGRAVAIRPFVGLRNGPSLSGIGSSDAFKFVVGICLYRWL